LAYKVEITDSALEDAEEYVEYIRLEKKEPRAAERWFRGLVSAILSLEKFPFRCARIPEVEEFALELRHLIYHSHRIIYYVDSKRKIVKVLRVYHGARRPLREPDIEIEEPN
jgi:plasmid stabilization system protein ParE